MVYVKIIILSIVVFASAAWLKEPGNVATLVAYVKNVPTCEEVVSYDLTGNIRKSALTQNYLDAYEKSVK